MDYSEDYSKHYTLMINLLFKKAFLNRFSENVQTTELVYSDNLEDIAAQLLFYGFKIVKDSKHDTILNVYYDLESI